MRNHFTPAIGNGDVIRKLVDTRPSANDARRSGVEELLALLVEAQIWRMRLIELTFASIIFFSLGFAIAVRCP
jgi:hypothetical protein